MMSDPDPSSERYQATLAAKGNHNSAGQIVKHKQTNVKQIDLEIASLKSWTYPIGWLLRMNKQHPNKCRVNGHLKVSHSNRCRIDASKYPTRNFDHPVRSQVIVAPEHFQHSPLTDFKDAPLMGNELTEDRK